VNGWKIVMMLVVGLVLTVATPAWAQENNAGGNRALIEFSGALGAGITTLGAAFGIGRLGASALESMARQPEVAGNIQTAMIIAAALIEGFTFFALVICMLQNPWAK
jgi:F-type H+-transporting ATPase subunit c